MKYPTKKQILAPPRPKFKTGLMVIISGWKKIAYKYWKIKSEHQKLYELQLLGEMICDLYEKPRIMLLPGKRDMYNIGFSAITLKEPYSIVSFFHELAHHLFGKDELTACRWSVWLYQLRFRKDYEKLIWNEHLLTKPPSKSVIAKSLSKERKTDTTRSRAKAKEDGE